jgi:hypothetical protein
LPLYLAEVVAHAFEAHVHCVVLVARGAGPVVSGAPWPYDALKRMVAETRAPSLAVSGSVAHGEVRIDVWSVSTLEVVASVRAPWTPGDIGSAAVTVERELVGALTKQGIAPATSHMEGYAPPQAANIPLYAFSLEQLLYQVLVCNDLIETSSIYNERGFYESYMALAEAMPAGSLAARLFLICGVACGHKYGSPILAPYLKVALRWIDEAPAGSTLRMLAPAVLLRLGETGRFTEALASAASVGARVSSLARAAESRKSGLAPFGSVSSALRHWLAGRKTRSP